MSKRGSGFLKRAHLKIATAEDLNKAAELAVKAVKGGKHGDLSQ